MFNIFYCDIYKISDKSFETERNLLNRIILEKIDKKQSIDDRKRSIAGFMLARRYTAAFCGVSPKNIEFAFGEYGKPYVINQNVHYNISHSFNYVVLAVSNEPIGIDVETVREFSAVVAQKKFTQGERDYISLCGSSKSLMQKAFYEIWTAKEAYIKYTGKGLSEGIESLELTVEDKLLLPKNIDVNLRFDYSIPGAVIAVVTKRQRQ